MSDLTEFQLLQKEIGEMNNLVKKVRDVQGEFDTKIPGAVMGELTKMETRIDDILDKNQKFMVKMQAANTRTTEAAQGIEAFKNFDGAPVPTDPAVVKLFFDYMRKGYGVIQAADPIHRKALVQEKNTKALVENSTGQILVLDEIEKEIFRSLPDLSVCRLLFGQRNTKTEIIQRKSLTDVVLAYGGKPETGGTTVESDMVPTEDEQYIEDCTGMAKIGEDLLEDSNYNLAKELTESFKRAKVTVEEDQFINGAGHASKEPEGLLSTAAGFGVVRTATATALIAEDFMDLKYGVKSQYRNNGSFLIHSDSELAILKLRSGGSTTGDGPFIWQPSIQAGTPNKLLNRPVYTNDNIEDTLAVDNKIGAFGDFKLGMRIVDRLGLKIQKLVELFIGAGLVAFRARFRNTCGAIDQSAVKVLQCKSS